MFAMLITSENLPKITEESSSDYADRKTMDTYLALSERWYAITGYTSQFGEFFPLTVLQQYILDHSFQYDPVKIQSDWDQIVRK